jgi:hypothetical protein
MKKTNVGSVSQIVREEFLKDKYVKTTIYLVTGVAGLFVCGFVLKALTYALHNYKALNRTLKL